MWNWISKLEELRSQGAEVVAVTVTQCTGSTPRETGAKMLALRDGTFFGTIGGGHLEELALADARKCLDEEASRMIRYPLGAKTGQCCGGIVELLFEVINAGPRLYLFGAGHVGQAVCRTLIGTPFRVQVIDDREEWLRQLPEGVARHDGDWDDLVKNAPFDERGTYVAVMTHRHDLDQEIIAQLVRRPARYLGLLGSKSKWERIRQRLLARGVTEAELSRVNCPMGIDIGGKSPQEVAISLASELLRIHYGKPEV
jgi:xanthine dehydrogenase accessory factor